MQIGATRMALSLLIKKYHRSGWMSEEHDE
jgi:hypothetical protein